VLYNLRSQLVSGNRLNRQEASALLKELITNDLIDPNWVSIGERHPKDFQLQFKTVHDSQKLEALTRSRNLVIEVDKKKGYIFIYKPADKNLTASK
jgi:hypothetical protein